MTDLRDAVFNDLRQAAAEGRMPSTREPLPLRSIADAVLPLLAERIAEARAEGAREALRDAAADLFAHRPGGDVLDADGRCTMRLWLDDRARADAANTQEPT